MNVNAKTKAYCFYEHLSWVMHGDSRTLNCKRDCSLNRCSWEKQRELKKKKSKVSALGFLLLCFAWCSILVRIKLWALVPSLPEVKPASPTRQLGGFGPASSSVKQGWKGASVSLGDAMIPTAQSEARPHRLMAESSPFRHQPQA